MNTLPISKSKGDLLTLLGVTILLQINMRRFHLRVAFSQDGDINYRPICKLVNKM